MDIQWISKINHLELKLKFYNMLIITCLLIVSVSDWGVLNQPVNVNCVPLILNGDVKRHKVYTGSGNRCPTSSLRDRSCIPCTEVLVVGGYKLGREGASPRSRQGVVWAA